MTDNSVSSADANWTAQTASHVCSDFKAAVCSSGESHWNDTPGCDDASWSCEPQQPSCEDSHPTCGSQPAKENCGLPTTGFHVPTSGSCGIPTTGFHVPVSGHCGLPTTGFQTDVSSCASLSVSRFQVKTGVCVEFTIARFHVKLPECGCIERPPVQCAPKLTVCGDTVNTGHYTIKGSTDHDGSLTITDNCTGKVVTQIWGDPHVNDASGKEVGNFADNNLNITLPDGSRVLMQPTDVQGGVAHLANATVTAGNNAVTINGVGGSFQNGVTLSNVFPGAAAQNAIYANGATEISMSRDGRLFLDTETGTQGRQIVAEDGKALDLDGLGGKPLSAAA